MSSMITERPSASNTEETLFIIFPPFPIPPPDLMLIPFKDFKARGIQLFSEFGGGGGGGVGLGLGGGCVGGIDPNAEEDPEDRELDALGIPTVELRVKHTTDECKSNTRKRKRKKKTTTEPGVPPKKLPWYEEWEEGEDLRVTRGAFDPSASRVDRLFHASNDFQVNRTWPPVTSGVSQLWDQFRLYVGLLVNPTVYRKPSKEAEADDDCDDDDDDDAEEADKSTLINQKNADSGSGSGQMPLGKNRGYSVELDDNDDDDDDETLRARKTDAEEQREEKLIVFLNDPEKSIAIFLSSHMREQGLIWSERNLINAPYLIGFFLKFVLRNRVLPKAAHEIGFRRALDIVEVAKKQLPLTYKIGQALPDQYSEGCKECFGRKGGIEWSFVSSVANANADHGDPPGPVEPSQPRMTVVDQNGAEMDIVLPDTEETALKDAIEDNVDMEIQVTGVGTTAVVGATIATAPADIWSENSADTGGGGWGGVGDTNGWGFGGCNGWDAIDEGCGWGSAGDDDDRGAVPLSFAPEVTEPSWLSPPPSLTSLLGPTVLPLTHRTGIVESSTRRIKAIHAPVYGKGKIKGDAAEMVEDELERRFGRVVMSPWGREESDIPKPTIRKTSRGAVVMGDEAIEGSESGGPGKAHNPYEDDVVLVVEANVLDKLSVGMGLGGLWVQLVREEGGVGGEDKKKSRGKRGKKKPRVDELSGNYWYLEELMGIFPSYFMSREDAK